MSETNKKDPEVLHKPDDVEEKDMTPDERMAWLRERVSTV